MPAKAASLLLLALVLAGCGTISERGRNRVDVLCGGYFEDMGTCRATAERYCHGRGIDILHDYSQDTPPSRRLMFTCK